MNLSILAFFVSLSGSDANPGTEQQPFASLERARDAIRATRAQSPAKRQHPATVWLAAGDYVRDSSFLLSKEDSGTADAPVVYRAQAGASVRLLGGRRLTRTAPVTDAAILKRLPPAARPHVLQADLRSHGVTDFGALSSRGFSRPTQPAHLELFCNGQPMTVAQWPNAGEFTTITGFPKPMKDEWGSETGELSGGFKYLSERPRGWAPSDDIWVHGYWSWDWANSVEHVRRLDPVNGVVETDDPFGLYSFRAGQRFYFLNVLEELDAPGEYYVDAKRGLLYFWPPAGTAGAELLASVVTAPLISLDEVSHVEFRDLTLEAGRGMGIRVKGGEHVRVSGCAVRNFGTWGIEVDGGLNHTVAGCDIRGTGDGGISITGGDRKTLSPCGHTVSNNHIEHYARWTRCYVAGINASGVGLTLSHNLIHDAPHNAILFWGNDITIEFNEIYRVCLETGDAGAIYTGRNYTFRGNVIRHNFIHHMGGVGMGSMGIYMDDNISGTRITGNIFQEATRAVMLGGGRDFLVDNNVFVDCRPALYTDGRGIDPNPVWQNMVYTTMKQSYAAMNPLAPPYSARYPELASLQKYFTADAPKTGVPPENNHLERNICSGGVWRENGWGQAIGQAEEKDNLVGADPLFTDPAFGVFSLRPESPAWKLGFKPIPVAEIGLVKDADRQALPPHARASLLAAAPVGANGAVRLELRLRNDSPTTLATGTAMVKAWGPKPVHLSCGPDQPFNLKPGETKEITFSVESAGGPVTVSVTSPDAYLHPAQLTLPLATAP